MATLTLPIAKLAKYIEEYKQFKLKDNEEIEISNLNIKVPTPTGSSVINHIIKKYNLPILRITLSNDYVFKAASKHIVLKQGNDTYLSDLKINDILDHKSLKPVMVTKIQHLASEDCYDIGIDSPHIYYDANGLAHHNTITTATLSKICEKYGRSVVIVPNKSLVEQTEEDYRNCRLDVGVYYGDRKELGKTHTICTWQSLNILDKKSQDDPDTMSLAKFLNGVQAVIVDEVHMAKGTVLKKLLTHNLKHASIRWGLTGTIPKDDLSYQSIRCGIGDLINRVGAHELQQKGILSNCHVNIIQTTEWKEFRSYAEELKYLVTDQTRMEFVSSLLSPICKSGNTLILVDRIECGNFLRNKLAELLGDEKVVFVSGAVKSKERKEEYDEVKTSNDKVIVATYGVAAVGINIVRLNNLVMIEPGKSFVRVIQSIGRGLRKGNDKDHVEVYDITSTCKFSKRHLTQRKKYYAEAQYPFTIRKVDYLTK